MTTNTGVVILCEPQVMLEIEQAVSWAVFVGSLCGQSSWAVFVGSLPPFFTPCH